MNSPGRKAASLDAAIDEVRVIADGADEPSLARGMIEVRGAQATAIARDNARTAALGGQALRAKFWIRVLGMIQRQQTARLRRSGRLATPHSSTGDPASVDGRRSNEGW